MRDLRAVSPQVQDESDRLASQRVPTVTPELQPLTLFPLSHDDARVKAMAAVLHNQVDGCQWDDETEYANCPGGVAIHGNRAENYVLDLDFHGFSLVGNASDTADPAHAALFVALSQWGAYANPARQREGYGPIADATDDTGDDEAALFAKCLRALREDPR